MPIMFTRIFSIKRRFNVLPVAIFSIVLVLLAGNFMGCEPEDWMFAVDCNDCYGNQPDSAKLIVYLTIDSY